MPDVESAAVDQPSATTNEGGSESSSSEYVPSFLRNDEPEPEPESEATPETQTETVEGEGEPSEATEGAEQEPATEEGESEKASQDEFLASLSPEEVAYYAKRYPTLYAAYQDPNQPADLRQAFVDRVNQDHAYAALRDGQDEEEGEPTAEDSTGKTQPDPTQARQQYYSQIDEVVKTLDPQSVNELGSALLEAMGVDLKSKDPEIVAIVKNASKVGSVLARGAVDLQATTMGNMLPSRIETVFPGFSRMYYRALYNDVWNDVRNVKLETADGKGSKPYSKLPAYGTPEFQAAIEKAVNEFPDFEEMVFRDRNGQVLPPDQQAQRKYTILAKMMMGQSVNPAIVAQAVQTGKKMARIAEARKATGRVLGAGKQTGEGRVAQGSSNDDIFGPGVEEYKRRGG